MTSGENAEAFPDLLVLNDEEHPASSSVVEDCGNDSRSSEVQVSGSSIEKLLHISQCSHQTLQRQRETFLHQCGGKRFDAASSWCSSFLWAPCSELVTSVFHTGSKKFFWLLIGSPTVRNLQLYSRRFSFCGSSESSPPHRKSVDFISV